MKEPTERLPRSLSAVRVALVVFVVAWLFGPYALRSAVPVWLPFLVALGLEVNLFVSALRSPPPRSSNGGPQPSDRERFGYGGESDELVLVRREGEELWIPYSGQTPDELDALIAEARGREEEEDTPGDRIDDRRPVWPAVRRFLVGLGVIGALVLILGLVESRTGWDGLSAETRARAEERFSSEASAIAEKPVRVRCDVSGGHVGAVQHADGVAIVGGDVAYLTPERCLDLYRLAFKNEVRSSQTGRALAVLAHEAWHLHGVQNEGTTECYALQTGVALGRRLGLSEGRARQLMRQQIAENALHSGGSPEYLVPPECRDGGELDLDSASTKFP